MCALGIIFIIMAFTRFYNTVTAYWMPVVMVVLLVISVFLMIFYSGNYYLKHKNDEDYYDKKKLEYQKSKIIMAQKMGELNNWNLRNNISERNGQIKEQIKKLFTKWENDYSNE